MKDEIFFSRQIWRLFRTDHSLEDFSKQNESFSRFHITLLELLIRSELCHRNVAIQLLHVLTNYACMYDYMIIGLVYKKGQT